MLENNKQLIYDALSKINLQNLMTENPEPIIVRATRDFAADGSGSWIAKGTPLYLAFLTEDYYRDETSFFINVHLPTKHTHLRNIYDSVACSISDDSEIVLDYKGFRLADCIHIEDVLGLRMLSAKHDEYAKHERRFNRVHWIFAGILIFAFLVLAIPTLNLASSFFTTGVITADTSTFYYYSIGALVAFVLAVIMTRFSFATSKEGKKLQGEITELYNIIMSINVERDRDDE